MRDNPACRGFYSSLGRGCPIKGEMREVDAAQRKSKSRTRTRRKRGAGGEGLMGD